MIYDNGGQKLDAKLSLFLKPILCTSIKMTDARCNVKLEGINQPEALTRFNALPATSPTTVQERRKTLSGRGTFSYLKL